jgi:hypothetical protein
MTAAPMDRQDDLACCLVDIGDDIGDQSAQQPLTRAHGDARRIPRGIEVLGKSGKVGHLHGLIGRACACQSSLACLYTAQRRLPALLQLRGDEAIVGIAGGVAALREGGFILSLL